MRETTVYGIRGRAPGSDAVGLAICLSILMVGCGAAGPANPSFATDVPQAQAALREMQRQPQPLQRPLVILGGFNDPGVGAWLARQRLEKLTDEPRILTVSFGFCFSFDGCRRRVIAAVDEAFPSHDPAFTTEVDVVGISMGGLVARYAAAPMPGGGQRRLRISRLFTVSSPHRGAALAVFPALTPLHADMRNGSGFLSRLEQAEKGTRYELHPYVRLGDRVVGEANAAPAGRTPRWVPTPPLEDAHLQSVRDPRILADIARRLRGEPPLAHDPPAPLPPGPGARGA